MDVYSELDSPTEDILSANLNARYCGTVAPNVRIRYILITFKNLY